MNQVHYVNQNQVRLAEFSGTFRAMYRKPVKKWATAAILFTG